MAMIGGMLLVALAGLGTGSIAWPMKRMRRLQFEHYWFVGMLVGLVLLPWMVVLATVPDPWSAYQEVGWKPLLISNLFATGWGLANVLYGICVIRIGAALTGAILSGLGLMVGVTLPMIFKGTGLFRDAPDISSRTGFQVLAGVAILLIGVLLSTAAGFGRDRALHKTDAAARRSGGKFLTGLIMVVIAGVTSSGIALAFVYSQGPIVSVMKARGAGDVAANCAVWAAGLLGGAAVNILYPAWLMTRRGNWSELGRGGLDLLLAVVIGAQFILAVNLLGRGMLSLGALGASIGFGVQQAMQVLGNQAVGFASGEWRGVVGRPRTLMYAAIGVLLLGVVILAHAYTLTR
ncbi:MAG: L-rhamnose/proton symporter RhaT [Pirellulaceae bacterium]